MRALVVLSGTPFPDHALPDADLVVAADGGGNALADAGRVPDVLVGDLDSVRTDVLHAFRAKGVDVREHPRRKMLPDGGLAVDVALEAGAREIVLVAVTGGRFDQVLGNLQLVRRIVNAGARARAVDAGGELWAVTPEAPLELAVPPGTTVSVLPLTDAARGVRLTGFEWSLEDAVMRAGDPYGISNVTVAESPRVACAEGALVVVVPRSPAAPA